MSLILEYCSKGDMRSYLIHHRKEFQKSLSNFDNNGTLEYIPVSTPTAIHHDVRLLYRWTYQVRKYYILKYAISIFY